MFHNLFCFLFCFLWNARKVFTLDRCCKNIVLGPVCNFQHKMQHKTPQCTLLVTKNKQNYLFKICNVSRRDFWECTFTVFHSKWYIYSYYLQKPYIWQNCTVKLQVTLYNKILVFNALSNYQWEKKIIHWRKRYYGLWTHIFVKSILMLD